MSERLGESCCRTRLIALTEDRFKDDAKKIIKNIEWGDLEKANNVPIFITKEAADNYLLLCEKAKTEKVTNEELFEKVFGSGLNNYILALFGRFVASAPDVQVKSPLQTAHMFSVSETSKCQDFFTAVDDLVFDKGSSHMGYGEYSAPVNYRYACLDCVELLKNCKGDREIFIEGLSAWLAIHPIVVPGAKNTSTAPQSRPEFVMFTVGSGQPMNIATAFLNPVEGRDIVKQSIERMSTYYKTLTGMYGTDYVGCQMNAHGVTDFAPNVQNVQNIDAMVKFITERIV